MNGGSVGGPPAWPVMWANPLIASPSVPNPGRSLFGPGQPVSGDVQHHDPVVDRAQALVVQAPFAQGLRPGVEDDDVGVLDQPTHQRLAFGDSADPA